LGGFFIGQPCSEVCRVYLKRIEHIYFKFDTNVLDQKAGKLEANKETSLQVNFRDFEFKCSLIRSVYFNIQTH
jgi:hypothetical protein